MDISSLKSLSGKQQNPYAKLPAVKLCIGKIFQSWTPYTRGNGKTSHFMKCYGADHSAYVEVIAYDLDSQESILKEGRSVLIKNYIMKDDMMKLTSTTKIYRCEPITDTVSVPSGMEYSPVKEISSSPTKKLLNIVGTVTKEESIKEVMAQNKKTKVKEITVADNTGEVRVSLWDSAAGIETKCGKKYKILNASVKYSSFHGKNTLTVNSMSTVEELEEEERKISVEIIAISVSSEEEITIIVNDNNSTEYMSNQDVFKEYLDIPDKLTEDTIAALLPIKCKIKVKDMTVTHICDM